MLFEIYYIYICIYMDREKKRKTEETWFLSGHSEARVRLSGPREKRPRKKKKKKEEEEETGGKRGVQHHPLPFTSAILSPHPPVCRQSSSSLGLPLRGYYRGYSSATNVRSWFHSRCSNPSACPSRIL